MRQENYEKKNIVFKFSQFVVKNRWVFIAIFIALMIFAIVMFFQTKVTYDLSNYLPKKSDANIAMQLIKEEFDDKGMTYVMVENLSLEEAREYAENLKVEGVASVIFDETTGYNAQKQSALYTVSFEDYDSTKGCFEATKRLIDSTEGKTAHFYGQSASSYYTKLETEKSIYTIGIVIVIVIIAMLLFTSRSYIELLLMILVFGVAVVLNMGTNFLFNGISYVSNLVALVLQLALSIDYSVILLHRYMEERHLGLPAFDAVVTALTKGIKEIFSSSLTTIAGLCALMLMSLPIGVEIGISLAKSIAFSLLAVIFLMPALLVAFDKPLEKTKHKSFVPNVTKPFRAIVKARKVIVPIFIVLIVLSCVGQFGNVYAFNMNGAKSIVDTQVVFKENFSTLNSLVVVVPKGDYAKQRELAQYMQDKDIIDSCNALSTIQITEGVYLTDSMDKSTFIDTLTVMASGTGFETLTSLAGGCFDKYLSENAITDTNASVPLIDLMVFLYNDPTYSNMFGSYKEMLGQLIYARQNLESENFARLTFNIDSGVESPQTFALIKEVKQELGNFYEEFYITGESVVCYDMAQYFPKDNLIVCVCTLAFVLAILLLTFRNLSLPFILSLAIQGGIWINFVIPFLAGNTVSFIGYLIISAVQMGATIDYAIVLTNRYRSTKKDFANRYDAMAAAQNAVFPTIITSGVILIVTGFALGLLGSGVVAQLGTLLGIGVLTSVLVVLFVLPSMLLMFERFIDATEFSKLFVRKNKNSKLTSPICEDQNSVANDIATETSDNPKVDAPQ